MDIKEIAALYYPPGVVALSKALGLSRGAASQWEVVPSERVLDLCSLLEWKCTPHQIRPDLYPNPGDALPRLIPAEFTEDRRIKDQRVGDRRIPDLFDAASEAKDEAA